MTEDLARLRQHIGAKETTSDLVTAYPPNALIATLDRDEAELKPGDALPPGWSGLYFLAIHRPAVLAQDGLATETGVIPKMPLPRRMYAGERYTFHRPIRIGQELTRETELKDITIKDGSTGQLAFVTVVSRIHGPDGLAVEEERDSVFREEVAPGAKSGVPRHEAPPADTPWRRTVTPNPVMLFRYSALTFNGHRIHYDRPYAMEVEGYAGLIVHGPLTSTMLIDFARDNNPGRTMTSYHMRAKAPLFDTAPFDIVGRPSADGNSCEVWAVTPEGTVAMSAQATFA